MDNNWKFVIKVLACMLSLIIVCVTVNSSIDKLTASVTPDQNQGYSDNGQSGGYVDNGANQGYVDNGQSMNTGVPSNSSDVSGGNSSTPVVTPSGNTGTQQPVQQQGNQSANANAGSASSSGDPTTFNKAQIVSYYNQCLRNTYSQPKFTVKKTEVIDVQLGEMLLNGKPATGIQDMANDIVAKNAAKGGTKTQNFTKQTAVVDAKERFILPANLAAQHVKSATVSKNGGGYIINFTLVAESCDFRSKPPANYSCTFPLDFTEIDLGNIGQITSAQFYYPGTTLQATIDGSGRVVKTYVVMPLQVDNAEGKGLGQTLNMDISGRWICTNINTF